MSDNEMPPPVPRPMLPMKEVASVEERLSRLELRVIDLLHRVKAIEG
jgi:hypothetical protein